MKHHATRTIDFRNAPPSRWTCIGRPDDAFKTVVREDGALLYDYGQPARAGRLAGVFYSSVAFGLPAASAPQSITQRSDDPGNSIVVTVLRYPKATLTLQAFGHADAAGRRAAVCGRTGCQPVVPSLPREQGGRLPGR